MTGCTCFELASAVYWVGCEFMIVSSHQYALSWVTSTRSSLDVRTFIRLMKILS